MAQKQPEHKPTKPEDVLLVGRAAANILSMCVTPFLRKREGCKRYVYSPVSFLLMLGCIDYCPALRIYLPIWTLAVLGKRVGADLRQHSLYGGYPWITGMLFRREKLARSMEVPMVLLPGLAVGLFDEHLGRCIVAAALSLGIVLAFEVMEIRSAKIRMRDARAEMAFHASLQRGDSGW